MAARPDRQPDPLVTDQPRRVGRLLSLEVACERKDATLELQQCLTDYVNANALKDKASPCFGCSQGLDTRLSFAKGNL